MGHRIRTHKPWYSKLFDSFGLRARVDVVAQQELDHEAGIFKCVKSNDLPGTMREIQEKGTTCLELRDSVGAAPIHIAFLYGHYELGKAMVLQYPSLATLTYTCTSVNTLSPYEGENILHIVIIHRQRHVAQWLVHHVPQLIQAECIGKFFRPSKPCYFGGTPLLFALSSNQISIALDILEAAERLKHPSDAAMLSPKANLLKQSPSKSKIAATVSNETNRMDHHQFTSIFMCDSYGNNVLHLAVLHKLPKVYDFAVHYAMQVLGNTDFTMLLSQEVTPYELERQRKARFISFVHQEKRESLVDFLKRANSTTSNTMMSFLQARNTDELTPLSLAAAIGQKTMFQHILQQSTSMGWSYGPIIALNIPLRDLEEPQPRPEPKDRTFHWIYTLSSILPYPLAPKTETCYKTAIQCLCSYERLSNTIPKSNTPLLNHIYEKRLKMLKLFEITELLHKKWKYVGKQRFMSRWIAYTIYLITLNVSVLFDTSLYEDKQRSTLWQRIILGVCESISYSMACLKFINEAHQFIFNFHSYISEAGAGRLDNVLTMGASLSLFLSGLFRIAGRYEIINKIVSTEMTDATVAVALVFSWLYLFFFLLGFRSTGPFVIMILKMIQQDIVRFICVYIAVMAGFSQAVYVVHDGRSNGYRALMTRVRKLVIAGFTGEVNYDDNYTSGRMTDMTQILMLAYIVLVMILLVNLLIAMMGNTYNEILVESEQRWVAERANIMSTIENQCPSHMNRMARHKYAIPLMTRDGQEELYLQLETNHMKRWKEDQMKNNEQELAEGLEFLQNEVMGVA